MSQPDAEGRETTPALDQQAWFQNLKAVRDLVQLHGNRKTRHHLLAAIDEAMRRLRAVLAEREPK